MPRPFFSTSRIFPTIALLNFIDIATIHALMFANLARKIIYYKLNDEEQNVEKIAAELKKVIEKATTKKKVTVRGTKGAGKKNDWWDKECEQSKKEAVKALRKWRGNKIDRNRFLEVKTR
jgi:hypothetical protein